MKKVLYFLLIVVLLWVVILAINCFLMFSNQKPLIYFNTIEYKENDTDVYEYHSLGYKIILRQKGLIQESTIRPLWVVTAPKVDFYIKDVTGETCMSGRTYFYEDEHFKYYFNCNRKINIQIGNKKYSLEEALRDKKVTIESLKANGLEFTTESKVQFTMELTPDTSCKFLEGDESKLVLKKDNLYYYCVTSANVYVNKNYSSFEQAFNNTIKLDSITVALKKEIAYDSGTIMYSTSGFKLLVCNNGKTILGPTGMEYFDIFCK